MLYRDRHAKSPCCTEIDTQRARAVQRQTRKEHVLYRDRHAKSPCCTETDTQRARAVQRQTRKEPVLYRDRHAKSTCGTETTQRARTVQRQTRKEHVMYVCSLCAVLRPGRSDEALKKIKNIYIGDYNASSGP